MIQTEEENQISRDILISDEAGGCLGNGGRIKWQDKIWIKQLLGAGKWHI